MINLRLLVKINISKQFKQFDYQKYLFRGLLGFGLSLCSLCSPTQVKAADEISFYYDPFGEFNIQVDDLEILANEGIITKKLAFFTNRLTPKQLEQLEDLLSRQIKFNPIAIKTYISDRSEYSSYLNTTYLDSLNSKPFEFSVIRSLTETQLEIEPSTASK